MRMRMLLAGRAVVGVCEGGGGGGAAVTGMYFKFDKVRHD